MQDIIDLLISNGYAQLLLGFVATTLATLAIYAVNKGKSKAARLISLASDRWPAIDLALNLVETQVDAAVANTEKGRYLPVYQVAKKLFTEEGYSVSDVAYMANWAAQEFLEDKYDGFVAKYQLKPEEVISGSESKLGRQVADAVLAEIA